MLKSTVFFELLLWTCVQHSTTQYHFIEALQCTLSEICKSLIGNQLREMADAWDSAQMLIVQKPMHAKFVELYKRMHAAIVGFLENNVWQFKKIDCV